MNHLQKSLSGTWRGFLVLAAAILTIQLLAFSYAPFDGSASISLAKAYADDSIPPRKLSPVSIPEPLTAALLGLGLVSVGLFARSIIKRRKDK
jgi:hypothetical protein